MRLKQRARFVVVATLGVATLAVLASFGFLRLAPPGPWTPSVTDSAASRGAPPASRVTPAPTTASARFEGNDPVPRTLRGTRPSGGLHVDAAGHFAADRDAILFFEYFLSAARDEPVDRLLARIHRAIEGQLEPPADVEALAFFDRYLGYLESSEAEFSDPELSDGADLERRLQWIREHRREHFGAALAQTLFGEEEQATQIYAAMRSLRSAEGLSAGERARRLEALEGELSAEVRAARERAVGPLRLAREERRLRDEGAGPDEIHRLRAERYGHEAAERLRLLDVERTAWNARMDRYREARARVLDEAQQGSGAGGGPNRGSGSGSEGSPEAESLERELDALRREHFAADEVERVIRLERVEASARAAGAPLDVSASH